MLKMKKKIIYSEIIFSSFIYKILYNKNVLCKWRHNPDLKKWTLVLVGNSSII